MRQDGINDTRVLSIKASWKLIYPVSYAYSPSPPAFSAVIAKNTQSVSLIGRDLFIYHCPEMQSLLGWRNAPRNTTSHPKYLTELKVQQCLGWQPYCSWNLNVMLMATCWLFKWGLGITGKPRGLFHSSPKTPLGNLLRSMCPLLSNQKHTSEVS